MTEEDLAGLARRITLSDHKAFKEFFYYIQRDLFRFLLYKCRDLALAEDLLQEAFLKFWLRREKIDETRSIKNLLFTIANNLHINEARHLSVVRRHECSEPSAIFSHTTNPEYVLEEKEFLDRLKRSIDALPEKTRVVFMMSRFDDIPNSEIAERLDLSIKSVEGYMTKALKTLKEKFPFRF
ncbi:MAG: sigma-70 family RNA polymerase sigma factor [Chryseolinea sp.]